MSQSTEKRARRAWRNRMQKVAGDDWENAVDKIKDAELIVKGYETTLKRQKIIIIILSITTVAAAIAAVWGWF